MKLILTFLISGLFFTSAAQDSLTYKLDEVVVTSSVAPLSLSDISRTVNLISSYDISNTTANSVQELLQYTPGVDLRQRGVEGIQSDIGIRGGTFEQTLILINGIKVIDPQTGHHNLNLPMSLNDIKRIEVLKGPGSKTYGANAFAGAINIITKKESGNTLSVNLKGGSFGYLEQGLSASFDAGKISNRISAGRSKSDGYIHNTGFENINFSNRTNMNTSFGSFNLFLGYNDKKFGANGFYASAFPNQWEHTKSKFVNFSSELGNGNIIISPKLYWRRNDDEFLLDYTDPGFYKNVHQTDVYGFEISSSVKSDIGTTSFGGEFNIDKIASTNLGNHQRERKGIFAEQLFYPVKDLHINLGAYLYKYAELKWKFWPGLDVSYSINDDWKIYSSYGKAFRIPTYTELYYTSPANTGNPDLKSEEVTSYEAGFYFVQNNIRINAAVFHKKGKNIIDWSRSNENEPWKVRNIFAVNTNGMEFSFNYYIDKYLKKIGCGYSYINLSKDAGSYDSRYLLEHLRHQVVLNMINKLPFGILQSWNLRYEERVNFDDYFITGTGLSRKISDFKITFSVNNLFNNSYTDISGVPLPGRWIKGGIEYGLSGF